VRDTGNVNPYSVLAVSAVFPFKWIVYAVVPSVTYKSRIELVANEISNRHIQAPALGVIPVVASAVTVADRNDVFAPGAARACAVATRRT
jgi:hypothetical protein